ncbi:hypothetical protein PG994_015098 [Apiospora phragmitis]|uniref:Uncharacterized protein n=1 Tax=Apiospora phragmitis TaxID=2905665 RepID=A0ABR1SWV0_9PEZI
MNLPVLLSQKQGAWDSDAKFGMGVTLWYQWMLQNMAAARFHWRKSAVEDVDEEVVTYET